METDIRDAERRAKRYFYDDGLTEIAFGIMLFLLGAYFYGESIFRDRAPVRGILDVAFMLLILSGAFLIKRVISFLKFRITYRRTGYVSYKKKEMSPRRKIFASVAGALVGVAWSLLAVKAPSFKIWMAALNGLLWGIAVYLLARRTEIGRFYGLAAASVVIGLVVAFAGFGDFKGLGLYYGLFGASVVISGFAALILYLRRSRAPQEESHEP
jgi:xanthosine utilization system XapX-like protein